MAGNPHQRCSICSAHSDVLKAVNEALRNKTKLRELAASCGFSRSGLSRHWRRCVPKEVLAANREIRKLNLRGRRIVTQWPGPRFTLQVEYDVHGHAIESQESRELTGDQLKEGDVLICVEFEPAKPVRMPQPRPFEPEQVAGPPN